MEASGPQVSSLTNLGGREALWDTHPAMPHPLYYRNELSLERSPLFLDRPGRSGVGIGKPASTFIPVLSLGSHRNVYREHLVTAHHPSDPLSLPLRWASRGMEGRACQLTKLFCTEKGLEREVLT